MLLPIVNAKEQKFELTPELVLQLTDAQPRLFGFLLKRLGQVDQAHEVLQEVNLVICRKATEYQDGSDFMAWAYAIARFQVMAFRKSQTRDRLVFPEELVSSLDVLDEELHPESKSSTRGTALQSCLEKLPGEQRQLVLERYSESVPVQSIAEKRGKTANAVSMTLHRIREQLLRCMKVRLSHEEG